jgi:hypothetical protein
LEESRCPADAIATALDGLDLIVESLNEAAVDLVLKVADDGSPMLGQDLDERTETINIESFDFLDPSVESVFGLIDRFSVIEDDGQFSTQGIGLVEYRRMTEELASSFALIVVQVFMVLA